MPPGLDANRASPLNSRPAFKSAKSRMIGIETYAESPFWFSSTSDVALPTLFNLLTIFILGSPYIGPILLFVGFIIFNSLKTTPSLYRLWIQGLPHQIPFLLYSPRIRNSTLNRRSRYKKNHNRENAPNRKLSLLNGFDDQPTGHRQKSPTL